MVVTCLYRVYTDSTKTNKKRKNKMFGIKKENGIYSVEIGNSTTITTTSLWLAIETKILGW